MTAPIVILSDYGMGAGTAAVKGVCKRLRPKAMCLSFQEISPR